jgi:hypothetical protein
VALDPDPVFQNYRGLVSFANPYTFDAYINDAAQHIERSFNVIIEPSTSTRDCYEAFLRGITKVPKTELTLWRWIEVVVNAVAIHVQFGVGWQGGMPADLEFINVHPAYSVAVILGLATMRAELGVPMHRCQISLSQVSFLVQRLAKDKTLWMFDQSDLLGDCVSFAG